VSSKQPTRIHHPNAAAALWTAVRVVVLSSTVFFDAFCLLSAIGLFSNQAPNIIRPFGCTAIGWIALAHFGW
jgi:hypothetical protein